MQMKINLTFMQGKIKTWIKIAAPTLISVLIKYNEYTFLFIFKNLLSAVLMCYGYEKCIAFTTQIFPKLTKCKIRKDTMLRNGTKSVLKMYTA